MKRYLVCLLALGHALTLAGCHRGSSAPAPTDVVLKEGDGIITVTWTMTPGVDYWLFHAAAGSITTDNWFTLPGAGVVRNATSPYILTGLTNNTTYSVTINGRTDGGPGGPGSPSLSAMPRLAGATWANGAALGNPTYPNLNGLTYGSTFVTVGDGGFIATSADGKTWAIQSSSGTNLNAIAYGGSYVAVGTGGVVQQSQDGALTWPAQTSNTTNDLFGVTAAGSFFVAVGANKTIITSSGGSIWSLVTSTPASNSLYGVAYGNGRYVAVGAAGTILTSTDAAAWTDVSSSVTPSPIAGDLKGVVYGNGMFVAVGTSGALVTSTDGTNWTQGTSFGSSMNAVTYATQFIAAGNAGAIYTSTNGTAWATATSVTPPNSNNLNAVAPSNNGYVAVGAAGTNLTAY